MGSVSRHRIAAQRSVLGHALASKALLFAILLLALLAFTGCSGHVEPAAERVKPSVTFTTASLPVARTSTPTSLPVTPTVPKPTATFVPLITPSPTPEGSAPEVIVPRIGVEMAKQMADAGEALLVDVRTKATFDQAHVAGAISLPVEEMLDRYHELPTDRLVIFYCA